MQTSAVTGSGSGGVATAGGAVAAHSDGSRGKGSAMDLARSCGRRPDFKARIVPAAPSARPEVELRARADAGRPARGHGLELGVEAHAFHAVDAVVAEHRGLPAAEAVVGDG